MAQRCRCRHCFRERRVPWRVSVSAQCGHKAYSLSGMLSSVLHVTILGGFRWYPVTEKYMFWFLIWGVVDGRIGESLGWLVELNWIELFGKIVVLCLCSSVCIYVCVCLYVNPSHCLKCKFALIIRSFSSAFYGVLFCSFRSPSSFFFIKLCGYCWVFLWYFGVFF